MPDPNPFVDVIRGRNFPVSIWADKSRRDFVLVDIDAPPNTEGWAELLRHREHIGVFAIDNDGVAHSAVAEPLDTEAIEAVVSAYVRHIEDSVRAFVEMPRTANA